MEILVVLIAVIAVLVFIGQVLTHAVRILIESFFPLTAPELAPLIPLIPPLDYIPVIPADIYDSYVQDSSIKAQEINKRIYERNLRKYHNNSEKVEPYMPYLGGDSLEIQKKNQEIYALNMLIYTKIREITERDPKNVEIRLKNIKIIEENQAIAAVNKNRQENDEQKMVIYEERRKGRQGWRGSRDAFAERLGNAIGKHVMVHDPLRGVQATIKAPDGSASHIYHGWRP